MAIRPLATLIVSVDVEFPDVSWGMDFDQLEGTARELLQRFNAQQIPATWGLSDVAHPLGDEIVCQASHELALHAGPSLLGAHVPRNIFVSELQKRLNRAQLAGHVPTTLQLSPACRVEHVDTLARMGVTAVSQPPSARRRTSLWQKLISSPPAEQEPGPRWVRWGLWQFQMQMLLPTAGLTAARRLIDGAVAQHQTIHIGIDVRGVIGNRRSKLATIEGVLRHAQQLRNAGDLMLLTVDQTVARTNRQNLSRPSQSILAARAA